MRKSITDWFYRENMSRRARPLLLVLAVLALTAAATGGSWYWLHKKQQDAEQARRQQAQQQAQALQNKRDAIHNFYQSAFSGLDVDGFLALYQEILRSRYPIELAGFTETHFRCTATECEFSYQPRSDAVFNVQRKIFNGTAWDASFSADSLDYKKVTGGSGDNPLMRRFVQKQPVEAAVCSELLNYIHSFNSLVSPERRFTLSGLPSSSVESDEQALADNPENYHLLTAKWTLTLADSFAEVSGFWRGQAFRTAFLINSVEKNHDTLAINGTVLCKK